MGSGSYLLNVCHRADFQDGMSAPRRLLFNLSEGYMPVHASILSLVNRGDHSMMWIVSDAGLGHVRLSFRPSRCFL
jgi:hypothetical protein